MKTYYFNTVTRNINVFTLLILFFTGTHCTCMAQTDIWAGTVNGGIDGLGTVFKLKTDGSNYTVCHNFTTLHAGKGPYYTTPLLASDNKLYGLTTGGGAYDNGVLFSYDQFQGQYTKLFEFRDTLGANPRASLVQASDGKLYGMTFEGGDYGGGVIFSYDITNHTYTKLLSFDGAQYGWHATGTLMQASDGKLYGTTYEGGNFNAGVLFSLDIATGNLAKLFDFNYTDGYNPGGRLVETAAHKLYCLTRQGGTYGYGVIFEFDMTAGTGQQVLSLDMSVTGGLPEGSLLLAPDGLLYGGTSGFTSQGVLFSFDPNTHVFTHEHNFGNSSPSTGRIPAKELLLASDGRIYGTTSEASAGTLFSYDYTTGAFSTLHTFGTLSGYQPNGGLAENGNGNLFGMTTYGGVGAHGIFFSYQLSPSVFSKLFDFDDNIGVGCEHGLTYANGKLYGIADGGAYTEGVAFTLDTGTFAYTKIHDFGITERFPSGPLLLATDGNLYGTTSSGGVGGASGTIFSIDTATGFITSDNAFNNATGTHCNGSLLQPADGYIYGLTTYWGQHSDGTIFRFDPQTWTLVNVFNFDDTTSGASPRGGLIEGIDGKLYGLTSDGGINQAGVLFSYDATNNNFVKLYDLSANSGNMPCGNMCQAPNGKLYGLTSGGGLHNGGTIICYDPATNLCSTIHDFDPAVTGGYALGSLYMAADSLLYGMTTYGGIYDNGVIFSLNTQSNTVTKLRDLNCPEGANPYTTIFMEIPAPATTTGLPKAEKATAFLNLTPVPASEKVRIAYTLPASTKHAELFITDFAGKLIRTEQLSNTTGYFDMNLTSLKAGAYICNVTGAGVQIQKKLMIVD